MFRACVHVKHDVEGEIDHSTEMSTKGIYFNPFPNKRWSLRD